MEEVEECFGKTELFQVEQTVWFCNCEHGNYLRDAQLKSLRYTNVVQQKFTSGVKDCR